MLEIWSEPQRRPISIALIPQGRLSKPVVSIIEACRREIFPDYVLEWRKKMIGVREESQSIYGFRFFFYFAKEDWFSTELMDY